MVSKRLVERLDRVSRAVAAAAHQVETEKNTTAVQSPGFWSSLTPWDKKLLLVLVGVLVVEYLGLW